MTEVWLRSNRQALALALAPLLIVAALAGLIALLADARWIRGVAVGVAGLALVASIAWTWFMGRPRLAYREGELLVNLRAGRPLRVPVDLIECCFLGQRPAQLGGREYTGTRMAAVVIRLAERASDWSHRDVEPTLGLWQDSYITIYGTWCEPLSIARITQLNDRLRAVQAEIQAAMPAAISAVS